MKKPVFKHKGQYELDLHGKLKNFLDGEFFSLCHTNVLTLDVTFAHSDEPIPFEEISTLEFKPIRLGESWAEKRFACAWFHLIGKLPKTVDRTELYLDFSNSGEGLLVDKTGHSVKGFTAGSFVFGAMNHEAEKRYYPLDDIVIDEDGNIDVYIDAAFNNRAGELKRDSLLTSAAIVRRNVQMQDLYWDFDVLLNYSSNVQAGDEKRDKIIYGLRKVMNLVSFQVPNGYEKAKEITKELFTLTGEDTTKVTAVGHAHLDLAWLWPIRESKRKAKRTFANALYLLKRYPEFHFVVPQPQQFKVH